jgi:hypothetical protein
MTSGKDLQERTALTLELPGVLPESVCPVVRWRKKDMRSANEMTLAVSRGLAVIVPMPVPTSAMQGHPDVFFDGYEVAVHVVEMPEVNRDGDVDLYDLIDMIALGLHWQPKSAEDPLAGMLAYPLSLAKRPVEMAEGIAEQIPGFEHAGKVIIGANIYFNAVLQINQPTD